MSHTSVRTPARSFVGRAAELVDLQDALESAAAGRGSLVLVTGEPGIGKTRLMQEFATAAGGEWLVLVGRCWEEGGAPAYWPWIQVVRGAGGEFERLAEEPSTSVDPDTVRFRLFDAVTQFLSTAAHERPLLIIVDDLHAADAPSLLLLRFLGEAIAESPVLVIGSYREHESRVNELAAHFSELVRIARRISLRGLSVEEVEAYVASIASDPARVATRLHSITGGNPFFLGEVMRLIPAAELDEIDDARDPILRIPEEVRALIRRRVARLSHETISVLRVAAVIGREFDLHVLERTSRLSPQRMLDVLAEAVDAGVLVEGAAVSRRYAFTHELVRETLYEDLPGGRRLELHLAIGRVLEELQPGDPDAHLSEIAHHLALAAPLGDVEEAVGYLARAGDRAAAVLAYEEAALHYERALQLLSTADEASAKRRCELQLRLGDSRWRAGDSQRASASFQEAASVAKELGDAEMLARGALGYVVALGGFLFMARFEAGATGIGLLEDALVALPEQDSSLRASVLARLAVELLSSHEVERRVAVSREAIEMARRLGDSEALVTALHCRHWALGGPETVIERLSNADEMLGVSVVSGNQETAYLAHNARFHAFLELADGPRLDSEIAAMTSLAGRMHQPFYRWHAVYLQTIRAIIDGRFDDSERLAREALGFARLRHSELAAYAFRYVQTLGVRWSQGRQEAIRDAVADHADRFPWIARWRDALAAAEVGDESAARAEIEMHAGRDFADLPRDGLWILHLSTLAEACVLVGDARRAAILYELLLPFADRIAVALSQHPFGPVSLRLGMLAHLLQCWDEAEHHFATALDRCERIGARAVRVRVLSAHAQMLLARGAKGDESRASALITEAESLCKQLGLPGLLERLTALQQASELPPRGLAEALFRREGEFWTIAYAGDTFRLRDVKGLRYLAFLLSSPGKDVHALELARAAEGTTRDVVQPSSPAAAGALLDAEAKEDYRRRLQDLGDELQEARNWQDPERVARVENEIDALTTELARAAGLGGRDRQFTSPAERARVSVTKAIRSAIKAIDRHSPPLGAHLADSIRTGRFCSYAPPGEAPPDWSL